MPEDTKEVEDREVPILSRLRPPPGAVRKKRRKGRGPASGLGKTAGRGMKGQKARKPGNIKKLHFEGGQMPLQRRLPKRGFTNIHAKTWAEVNIRDLLRFDAGAEVDVAALVEAGLVKGRFDCVKVLGNGELDRALTVTAHGFSAGARSKIEAAGGTAKVVGEAEGEASPEAAAPSDA
jgi:large subunit ribosomal protein L15